MVCWLPRPIAKNDADFAACSSLLETDDGPLVTTAMVVAEAAYLIDRQVGPAGEVALYTSIIEQALAVEAMTGADWTRVRALIDRYQDLRLGGTDAGLIAIAERLGVTRVATLDHRHFRVVRPAHCEAPHNPSVIFRTGIARFTYSTRCDFGHSSCVVWYRCVPPRTSVYFCVPRPV